jgi:hypothetical protein
MDYGSAGEKYFTLHVASTDFNIAYSLKKMGKLVLLVHITD